ncbi:hypothetical protein KQX54_000607 [Cotesia glomerata]|uniref:Uncharacterized protein n=1 Tax=Cotesia glomerata TaxID=32391 RepID=A0AAV7I0S4_COTGL|nr:hypothetical protein KQX54_000607 [Cotesia glomerata]
MIYNRCQEESGIVQKLSDSKQPKSRNSSRRNPTPSTASNTNVEDAKEEAPTSAASSPRKETGNNRHLTKKQQRELAPCKILLEQLEQQDEAWPFLLPVNTKQFPTYKKSSRLLWT